jgi:membrane associated rhomboid family serine protease
MNDVAARILALPASALLIGSVLIVSVWAWIFAPIRRAFVLVPFRVRHHGEVHRLLTAGWVHGDFWHLAFNMLTLYFFADRAMNVLGATRFLVLYVTAVVVAFVPTTLNHQRDPGYSSLGASGAVAAVMVSAILLNPKLKLFLMFLPIQVPGPIFAACYLGYSALRSYGSGDGVNHDAHFTGALYGGLLTWIFEPARVERTIHAYF